MTVLNSIATPCHVGPACSCHFEMTHALRAAHLTFVLRLALTAKADTAGDLVLAQRDHQHLSAAAYLGHWRRDPWLSVAVQTVLAQES